MSIPADLFGLDDADYWSDPHRTLAAFARDRVRGGIAGLAAGAPSRVDVDARDTLPMLVYRSDTLAEMVRTPFHHAVVVASRLDAPATLAGEAVIEEPIPKDGPPQAPEPGFGGGAHVIELREVFDVPWAPGAWIVRVLLRERQSNPVIVRLVQGQVEPRPSAVTTELSVAADRVVIRELGAHANVRVSIRVTGAMSRSAVLPPSFPVWLVVIGSRSGGFFVERIDIAPEQMEVTPIDAVISGHANLDFFTLPAFIRARAQTFFLYAFTGSAMSEPTLMGLLDPSEEDA